jgi:hypothetical protein
MRLETPTPLRLETFARDLLRARDLDPVSYTARRGLFSRDLTEAWLAAYWVLLDPGAACYVADSRFQWRRLRELVRAEALPDGRPWPRVAARRRFRGDGADRFLLELRRRAGSLSGVVRRVVGQPDPKHARDVIRRARELGFDRETADLAAVHVYKVLGHRLRFGEAYALRWPLAREAATLLWNEAGIERRERDVRVHLRYAMARLRRAFGPRMLPQDTAAILRRWASIRGGSKGWEIGVETGALRSSLEAWAPFTPLASRLIAALPRPGGEE